MNKFTIEECMRENKRSKSTRKGSQNNSHNSVNNRVMIDVKEIIEFVKKLNSTTNTIKISAVRSQAYNISTINEVQDPSVQAKPLHNSTKNEDINTLVQTQPAATSSTSKKRKSRESSLDTGVRSWIINKETLAIARERMLNSEHLRIPIALVIDLSNTLMRKSSSSKTAYLRPHVHQFVEFVVKNFYIINWTNIKAQSLLEVADTTFGPYKDYILCNLTKIHCCKTLEDTRKPFGIKDLGVIWESTFMVDPTSLPRTLPSPPAQPALEIKYEDEINRVTDPVSKKLYFGEDPNLELYPNSHSLKFDKTNTILLEAKHKDDNPQSDNLIMVSKIKSLKNIESDTTLLTLKDYFDTMATRYRSEFDKCEEEDVEFNFSVQDYMKNNPFKESHSLSSSNSKI